MVSVEKVYQFIPILESDLSTIWSWLQLPRVKKFWQESEDYEIYKHKYMVLKPSRFVYGFMILSDAMPIGYIQYYHASKVGGGWWPEASDRTFGLDFLIGNDQFIGKNLSSIILNQFMLKIKKETDCTDLIADPDETNLTAIKMFERSGFKSQGLVQTPYGESLLLTYKYD